MLVGVVGFIGSGKDTVADYLVNNHEFRRESFAGTLKDAIAQIFGWARTMLEGRTREARLWREQVAPWWSEKLGMPNLTPRWVLQFWGTEVCRKNFHDSIWIASLENKLRNTQDNVVISDCRFPNEISAIHRAGGIVIRVTRGPEPEWYHDAIAVNRGPDHNMGWSTAKTRLDAQRIHASETAWVGTEFDAVLDNNSTIDNLCDQVKNLAQLDLVSNPTETEKSPADS